MGHTEAGPGSEAAPARARRPSVAVLMCVGLAAMGSGAALTGASLPGPSAALLGREAPINAAAADPRVIAANNSPTLVRNPLAADNLVAVNRVDAPSFSCALHVSFNAGVSWEQGALPFPEGEELPKRCFAPDAAFGPDGALYVSFVTLKGLGNTPNAGWLVQSDDGGRTFSRPIAVLGPLSFQVRVATDPGRPGRLWLTWVEAGATTFLGFASPGNPVKVARSDDGGATWGPPAVANARRHARAVAPSLVVGHRGEPYLLYLDLGEDRLDYHGAHGGRGGDPYAGTWSLALARSGDGGATWRRSVVATEVVPTERMVVLFPPAPSLVVDSRRRRVVVAFADGRLGDPDVRVWASGDGGATFDGGRRVNDTRRRDGTAQYLPRLSLAPGGRIDVVYLDRRADRADVLNEVSLQSSADGGRSWSRRVRITTGAFDSGIGFGVERGLPDLGSRLALVSAPDRALALWPDTRAGTRASGKQDLVRAVVAFEGGSRWRGPLQAGGLIAVCVGAGALAVIAVRARRRGSPAGVEPGRGTGLGP